MEHPNMVTIRQFCTYHHIEISFIESLSEAGLLQVNEVSEELSLEDEELKNLEQIVNLFYGLGVNLEGIEVIRNLLQRLDEKDQEIHYLRNRLKFFE